MGYITMLPRRACMLLALVCLSLCLAPAAGQLESPKPRSSSELTFNPSNAQHSADDWCGNPQKEPRESISTLFVGQPPNVLLGTLSTAPPPGATFNVTLLQYVQNGTDFNPRTNVSTPIWSKLPTRTLLSNYSMDLRPGTNQRYYHMLDMEPDMRCGHTATHNPEYTQTRCVLRWVMDNRASGKDSRVSCADVLVSSRANDVRLVVRVRPSPGAAPVQPQSALNRLLNHPWASATQGKLKLDVFTLPDAAAGARSSNQLRMDPITPVQPHGDGTYSLHFLLSDTVGHSAMQVAQELASHDLSLMLGLDVIEVRGVNAATTAAAGGLGLLMACVLAAMLQRAL